MRKVVALFPALLAACSTAPAQPLVHGETPGHTCAADGLDQFIGQTRSDKVGKEIERVSKAAVLRWAPPNVMLTMDYRADRVTVFLDESNNITKLRCG